MASLGNIEYQGAEAENGRVLLPSGSYNMHISETKMYSPQSEDTQNPTKMSVIIEMTVLDGPKQSSKHSEWITIKHPNAQATQIGHAHAKTKILNPLRISWSDFLNETDVVVGRQLNVQIETKKGKDGKDYSRIKKSSPYSPNSISAQSSANQSDVAPGFAA